MIKNLFWLLIGATLVVSCGGDQINTTTSDGWKDLFNGTDLSGWTRLNGDADFIVTDSVIVGTTKKGAPTTFLATDKKFGDFALEFEVQVDTFINSGVQIRSNSTDYMSGKVHGYQVEIDPSSRGWSGGIYDQNRRGWLFPMDLNPAASEAFRPLAWNKFYVECIGSEIKTWVNDVPATFLIDDMTLTGFVALQIHSVDHAQLNGRKIKWRNIRIQENPKERKSGDFPYVNNTAVNDLSQAEMELGWHFLFNGESTENWRGAHSEDFPSNWEVKDGTLTLKETGGQEAAQGGDIVTKDEYAFFDLQVDFKLTKGANSGIKYFVTEEYDSQNSAIGLEYQILDDTEHPDAKAGLEGNRTLASLYDLIPADKPNRFVRPPGEWNRARIVVKPNNMVEHWLNYVKVLEYKRGSAAFKRLVALSKYKEYKGFGAAPKGHILLQDHGNEVSFRNIKIRNLQ